MASIDFLQVTKLPSVYLLDRPVYEDERGFFRVVAQKNELDGRLGFPFLPVQTNHSRSQKGVLRGIHIAPWHKLVTAVHGQVQQVVVDTRADSPTFGQYLSLTLGEDHWQSVFIPAGCGNAFLALSDQVDYMYLTTDYWMPGKETSIMYNDADLAIPWQNDKPLLSEKDLQNQTLRQAFPEKFSA